MEHSDLSEESKRYLAVYNPFKRWSDVAEMVRIFNSVLYKLLVFIPPLRQDNHL